MADMKFVYMLVSSDEYELPIAIADSPSELGRIIGVPSETVRNGCSKRRHGVRKSRYIKIEIPKEDNDMIKQVFYCDRCGKEIVGDFVHRIIPEKTSKDHLDDCGEMDPVWADRHFCADCMAKIVKFALAWAKEGNKEKAEEIIRNEDAKLTLPEKAKKPKKELLTADQIRRIKGKLFEGDSLPKIAEDMNIKYSTFYRYCRIYGLIESTPRQDDSQNDS